MANKTNAARLLDQMGIRYELREYAVDLDDLAAETVAAKIGLPPEQVFKTLVARGDRNGICMAVIPANTELDLKALGNCFRRSQNPTRPSQGTPNFDWLHPRRRDRPCGQERLPRVRG